MDLDMEYFWISYAKVVKVFTICPWVISVFYYYPWRGTLSGTVS